MGLFDKIKEPIFLKETSSAEKQLKDLQKLYHQVDSKHKSQIEKDIKLLETGIIGEKQIEFELKNSHMPMIVLHDLYFEKDGFSAQIDYLVVTRGINFVLECKNLFGNIEIDNSGNFIRTFTYGKTKVKEGIYSPITQNQRHLEVIRLLRGDTKNFIEKASFDSSFSKIYRSVVVLANPKTVLNAKYARKEIREQVIRADQLISYIKKANHENEFGISSEKVMLNLGQFFLDCHKDNPQDYFIKYRNAVTETKVTEELNNIISINDVINQNKCPKCGSDMIKRKATKGANIGKEFFGCSKFPKCRSTLNIDVAKKVQNKAQSKHRDVLDDGVNSDY